MKKIASIILLSILLAAPAIAELEDINANANGYNWAAMSISEKEVFITLLYDRLGTDRNKYPGKAILAKIDSYYSLARYRTAREENRCLNIPVGVIVGYITDCRIEIFDGNNKVKRVIYEPKS